MSDQLALYINDHLAGAAFAIELLDRLRESYSRRPLGDLAAQLLVDIDADRTVLQQLADSIGTGGSSVKNAVSWLAEKASRLKLRLNSDSDLGTFEAVEALSLGVLGKLKLWQALLTIQDSDPNVGHLDFNVLITRAQNQHDALESFRLKLARTALCGRRHCRGN